MSECPLGECDFSDSSLQCFRSVLFNAFCFCPWRCGFFASSDKKRKLETKQEPKQSKKLKKRDNNRKDMKLKRKK